MVPTALKTVNSLNILQRVKQWNAGVLTTYLLAQEEASDTCRLPPAKGLPFCTWNARGLLGSAASNQRPREDKLKYLKENGRTIRYPFFSRRHGRIEHLMNIAVVLDRNAWLIFFFNSWNVNAGGSVFLALRGILGPNAIFEHEEIFPGRDHLVRIRQRDRSWTIIDLHYQPEDSLQELRRRLRAAAAVWFNYPEGKGFLVGHFHIFYPAEGSPNARTQTFSDGDVSRAAALLTAFPRAVEINRPYCSRTDSRRDGSIHTLSRTDRIFTILPMA